MVVVGPAHVGAVVRGRAERARGREVGTARDILVAACGMYIWTRGQKDIYEVDSYSKEI